MTTTTIEQFREQCTDSIFAIKRERPSYDMDQYAQGWNAAIDEAVSAIAALPLPVMPSQDAEVMPEQAEPVTESTVREKFEAWADGKGMLDTSQDDKGDYFPIMTRGAWHAWKARDAENSALLARIAALEAENQKLKEDNAWIPASECNIGARVIVKVDDVVWHIIVEHSDDDEWMDVADEEILEDFHPSHFKYLPKP